MNTNQTAETTNPAQDSTSIFPEDAQVQTQANDGKDNQTQTTETLNESVVDQKEASNVAEDDNPEEGKEQNSDQKADDKKPDDKKEVKLELSKDSLLTESELESVSRYAKEKGLSQEDAQALLDMKEESVKRFKDEQVDMVESKKAEWLNDLKNDKELGGENLATSVSEAHRVVKQFFSEQFLDDLEKSGLGNYKEFVRGFSRIGKAMADDKFVRGGVQAGGEKTLESYFYSDKT